LYIMPTLSYMLCLTIHKLNSRIVALASYIRRYFYSLPFPSSSIESHLPMRVSLRGPCKIGARVVVPNEGLNLNIGRFTSVGTNTYLGPCLESIGSYTSIAPNCFIAPAMHHRTETTTSSAITVRWKALLPDSQASCLLPDCPLKPTRIGNNVWIGEGSFIRHGVSIGDGAIVAAHSVVLGNVPPYEVHGGIPSRLLYTLSGRNVDRAKTVTDWSELTPDQLLSHHS